MRFRRRAGLVAASPNSDALCSADSLAALAVSASLSDD